MSTINRPIVVLDTETTGLDVGTDYVIQVATVTLDRPSRGLTVLDEFVTDVRPPWHARWTASSFKAAQAVHGISWERMRAGSDPMLTVLELNTVRSRAQRLAGGAEPILAGCNVGYDYWMVKRLYKMAGVPSPWEYHTLDLSSLGMATLGLMSLKKIADALGIDRSQYKAHDALGDAQLTAECFRRLLPIIETSAQETVAGPVLEPVIVA